MTITVQTNSVSKKDLYLMCLRTVLYKKIKKLALKSKYNKKSLEVITKPKGPFAHKKSKEQYFLEETSCKLIFELPVDYGFLLQTKPAICSYLKLLGLFESSFQSLTCEFDF